MVEYDNQNIENTPEQPFEPHSQRWHMYDGWQSRYSGIGLTGVIALPNTTFEEWLMWYKSWLKQFAATYNETINDIDNRLTAGEEHDTEQDKEAADFKAEQTEKWSVNDAKWTNNDKKWQEQSEKDYDQDLAKSDFKLQKMSLSVTYNSNEPDRYRSTIDKYKDTASRITFVNMMSILSSTSSEVTPTPKEELGAAIKYALDAGYKIDLIKPHIGPNNNDGFAKFNYVPDDVPNFFKTYKAALLIQADLASENNIEVLSISTELNQLIKSDYMGYWTDIVNTIKASHPNLKLLASVAGAYDLQQQLIYKITDYIGINWYPEYTYETINSVTDIPEYTPLSQGLLNFHSNNYEVPEGLSDLNNFGSAAIRLNKKIWFTETGVMPYLDGLNQLISTNQGTTPYYEITRSALRVFFNNVATSAYVIGISWWHGQEPFNIGEIGTSVKSVAEIEWQDLEKRYL